ncbi:MAG: outer membrane protein assembly factor BamA [Rhodobacteraceae bacterium]|jgi:outer membrane protein insertion porin family|nr:outer membrane protein assembly factor BamA [Paracoccaceae bacterium]
MGSIRHFLILSTLSLCLFVTSGVHGAMAQDFSFSRIDVDGNKRIETSTIITYSGLVTDQVFGADDLNRAYQNILASGLFESVEVVPNGNRLVIKVNEFPTVNKIAFEGNRRINDTTLRAVVGMQPRRVFNPDKVDTDRAAIAQVYADQGRLAARVTPKIIRRSDNRVDVIFEIFEGAVTEIERIGIVGNKVFSDRRLRRVLDTKQAGFLRLFVRRDTFLTDRIEFDKRLLTDFYNARGYIDFQINDVNAELTEENNAYFVTFNVREGQMFRFGDVTLTSERSDIDVKDFKIAISAETGDVYSPTLMEKNLSRLEARATQLGLDFVRVTPRVTRNDADLTLDVEFVLEQGERVFVERIDITGNTTTLDRVIRRQFRISEGDPFNPRLIREAAERIRVLDFFGNAGVNARAGTQPGQIIVDVEVEERPTGSLQLGATYSGDNGFGVVIDYSERNFLGRGQTLSFAIRSGIDNQSYEFNFTEPEFLNPELGFNLGLSYGETDNQGAAYDTRNLDITPSLSFPLSEYSRLSVRGNVSATEMLNPGTVGSIVENEITRGRLDNAGFGFTYRYDTRGVGLDPSSGIAVIYNQDFGGIAGDKGAFSKSTIRTIGERAIMNDDVVLRGVLEAGLLHHTGGSSRVTDRFFLPATVLRGFEFAGMGPRQRDGTINDALGGNKYTVAKFEVDFPLGLPEEYGMSGGAFYHAGNLWDTGAKGDELLYDNGAWRHVVGATLYWTTPIGPLRFDFTRALKKETQDEERTFDMSIATRF